MATIDEMAMVASLMRKEAEAGRKKGASSKEHESGEGILKGDFFYEWVKKDGSWCGRCSPPSCGCELEPCGLFSNGRKGYFRKIRINNNKNKHYERNGNDIG